MTTHQFAASAHRIEQMVRADRLQLLFHQSFPAVFISIAVAPLLCWMLWPNPQAAGTMAMWFGALVLGTIARLVLFVRYFRTKPSTEALLRWERPYFLTLLLSSSTWGIGAALLLPKISAFDQLVTLFVLVGMAGGAISTYSAHRTMAVTAMCSLLLPASFWFIFQPSRIHVGLAFATLIFMIASLRATKVVADSLQRNFQLAHELKHAHDIADQLARTDPLTGLNNRRAFFEIGRQLGLYCRRSQSSLCMLLFDIDRFKTINDSHGHSAGDQALQQVGEILQRTFRKSDVCGRIGGEEFAILLPDTEPATALTIAETLRATIAQTPIALADRELTLTISIGVASGAEDVETLLVQSDLAMYRAKQEGRNRVVVYR